MARQSTSGKLTALKVKQAKPKDKPYKLSDGASMYLAIQPSGSRYWRMKYRINGKEKLLSIGIYPDVSLADARLTVADARSNLAKGIDPNQKKRDEKFNNTTNTFENIANEWLQKQSGSWSDGHAEKVIKSLKVDVFQAIGGMPIQSISAQQILAVIRKVEARGALDVASRVKQRISSIFRYAWCTGKVESNPADALYNVIKTRTVKHRPMLPPAELPDFLRKLDDYQGQKLTQLALKLLVHTFVRPGELRGAEWSEFDIGKAEWRIPAKRMKMNEEHVIPLSIQALEIISELAKLTRKHCFLFPGVRNRKITMSENTLTYAIRKRLGFDATAHGFRSTASTILNESGFKPDVIEKQLAHSERNKVRAAYNHSLYLADRKQMMQWWGNYLDSQRCDNNVVSFLKIK
ncbi:Integrase [hydrothermal vent metagenome]|uniref:Integrase n=1 Tax=hydrothermal vent metagenome TaxID=652676 RepID=A0A3B0YJF4_9ZZZZ